MSMTTLAASVALAATLALGTTSLGAITQWTATLNGPSESPPNASPGVGTSTVTYDDVAHTLRVQFSFSGLTGTTTLAHIHAATATAFTGTAGVATPTPFFPGFVTGLTAGSYDGTLDLTSAAGFNAAYLAANGGAPVSAETALIGAIGAGKAYLNIHTTAFGGGEIRGFLVPAPGTAGLLGLGGLVALRRRR